ncbi:LacI family DNA-binding transcriptional regulator [Actinoallomurus rhizosphaericola]|uniref:LacI family DNA-binding transcriptional regulator n=1 Tax=Actinoallomurus rhizosphaericola TaxID=2952536 RepID=UPI002092911D|nr:substrate-binding domain-containing protein [Actinoallomurus rhizosphaericola]MCO5997287.1 substrate-binding domain-containing protein [Actinoallomurus rhizosphaericola]
MSTVGIKDVAQRAGVSPGTVSNVLNRPERVAATTRARVQQAIRELGFVRNGSAATLRAGQSRAIGLVVLDVGNPFFVEVARGVEDVVSDRDHAVILCNSGESPGREARNLRVLAEQRVRGVLITPADEDLSHLEDLRERGIAVVLVDHSAAGDMCSVSVDDVAGGDLAVTHLLDRGAEHLAYVTGPLGIRQCAERRKGARRALRTAGLPARVLEDIVVPEMNAGGGALAAEKLLAGGLPDAIFCANDLLALGVLRALAQAGVRVPDDVALIGYDDIEFSSAAAVPLSSIRQPTYQLGKIATELLLEECDDPSGHAHQQIMFHPELVIRESSR